MIALDIPAQAPEKKEWEKERKKKNKVEKEEREGAKSKEGGKEKVKEMLEGTVQLETKKWKE